MIRSLLWENALEIINFILLREIVDFLYNLKFVIIDLEQNIN